MNLKMKKIFVSWCLSLFLLFAVVAGAHAYSSVLAFGDSLSDNGQYQGAQITLSDGTKVTSPYAVVGNTNPYDGFGFQRFSNGPVWVEYLAQGLGASLLDMAYGGATSGYDNPAAGLGITGLQWQVGAYATTYGPAIADNTLVTISAGGNDMFNDRDALTAAGNIAGVLNYLIGLGGDAFMVMNLSPSQQRAEDILWMATFNVALAQYIAGLGTLNPNVDFYLLDMTTFTPAGIDHFEGTYLANATICAESPNSPECKSGTFAWWDTVGVHPTTEVHAQIGAYAAKQVPEPASIILLILGFAGLVGARRRIK